jgi:hypothetical protein
MDASVVQEIPMRTKKIAQAETAIDHYYTGKTQADISRHEDVLLKILCDAFPDDRTLKELTLAYIEREDRFVADSSLCQPLHMLRERGKIENGEKKRPCRINRIRKQTWRVTEETAVELGLEAVS